MMRKLRSATQSVKARIVLLFSFCLLTILPAMGQTTAPAASADTTALGAGVVQKLAAGDFGGVMERFDAYLAHRLPEEKLAGQWKEFVSQAGAFVGVKKAAVTKELGGYRAVAMTISFQRAPENNALVVFDKDERIAGLYFGPQPTEVAKEWSAPNYASANRFHEAPVMVEDGPWHFPGTLTLPNGAGPFPAVLLVPGSPPLDQDATVGPNKVFKDLAWGLASQGIATLRYTKRAHQFGAGLGGGEISSFTIQEELNDDASAALSVLAGHKEIDHRRIYLLGHSLGGITVNQLASTNSHIAGIVVMGTPAGDLLTALVQRAEREAAAGGEAGQFAASVLSVFKKIRDAGFAPGEVVDLYGERNPVGFWEGLRNFQPGREAARLKIPVLVAVAKHDAQVPPDDFNQWNQALAGRANATVKFYPSLFHLFLPSGASGEGDTPEDWGRPGHVATDVVNDIASWVLSSGKK